MAREVICNTAICIDAMCCCIPCGTMYGKAMRHKAEYQPRGGQRPAAQHGTNAVREISRIYFSGPTADGELRLCRVLGVYTVQAGPPMKRLRLRLRIFPRPPWGAPRRVHSSHGSATSSIMGWWVGCTTTYTRAGPGRAAWSASGVAVSMWAGRSRAWPRHRGEQRRAPGVG